MKLDLRQVLAAAVEVGREAQGTVDILGVTMTTAGSPHVEVIIGATSGRFIVGIDREQLLDQVIVTLRNAILSQR